MKYLLIVSISLSLEVGKLLGADEFVPALPEQEQRGWEYRHDGWDTTHRSVRLV